MIVHTDFTLDFGNFWNLLSALSSVTMAIVAICLYMKWKDQAVYSEKWKLKLNALKLLNKFKRRWSDLTDEYNKTYGISNGFRDVKYVNSSVHELKGNIEGLREIWDEMCALEVELNDLFGLESDYKLHEIEHYLRNLDSRCNSFNEAQYKVMHALEVETSDTVSEYYNQLGEKFFGRPDDPLGDPWSITSLKVTVSEDFRTRLRTILNDYEEKLRKS